jgi:hypothetical protein
MAAAQTSPAQEHVNLCIDYLQRGGELNPPLRTLNNGEHNCAKEALKDKEIGEWCVGKCTLVGCNLIVFVGPAEVLYITQWYRDMPNTTQDGAPLSLGLL